MDIGCGDGTYTIDVFNVLKPKKISGIDISKGGIKFASKKVPKKYKSKISFYIGSIYDVDKKFRENDFDVVIIRGVLHHLDDPERAIKSVSKVFDHIVVFEPNGLNPILKIIERISTYHRRHKEKSYLPQRIDKWFSEFGYKKEDNKVFSIVPFFCDERIARALKMAEPFFERLILLRYFFSSIYLAYYDKPTSKF